MFVGLKEAVCTMEEKNGNDLERGFNSNHEATNPLNSHEYVDSELDVNILPSTILRTRTSLSEPLYKTPLTEFNSNNNNNNNNNNNRSSTSISNYYEVRRSSSFDIKSSSPLHHSRHETRSIDSIKRSWKEFLPLPLLKRMSSNPPPIVELCYCEICLENHPIYECLHFSRCSTRHSFCLTSLKIYFETQIREGIISHPCPSCHLEITEQELKSIVSDEIFSKYLRFLEMKANPGYRECPHCSKSTIGNINQLTIICSKCSQSYCFLHSSAHPNQTCQQYIQSQRRTEARNLQLIKRMSRKCPSCGCDTEKNGGCNHMTCRQCNENWCWLCGRNITGVINHYDTITGCPGGQFSDASEWALWTIFPCLRTSCLHYLTRIPYFLFLVCFLPVLFSSTIVSFFLSIPLLFLSFPFILCYKRKCQSISSYEKKCSVIGYDSFLYLIVILNTGLILFHLYFFQLIWFPFASLFTLVVFPSYLLSRRNRLDSWFSFVELSKRYFTWIDPDRTGYTNIYWCFPLSCFEYLIKTSLKDFVMLVSLKLEEQTGAR